VALEMDLPETVLMIVIAVITECVVPDMSLRRRFASSLSVGFSRMCPFDSPTVSTPITRAFLK